MTPKREVILIPKKPRVVNGRIGGLDALKLARSRGNLVAVAERFGTDPDVVETAREWYDRQLEAGRRKRKVASRRARPAAWTQKLDRLAGDIVRSRGVCEAKGYNHLECDTYPLQWCHGTSRRYLMLRWEPRNAWCMCRTHHGYFGDHPIEWVECMQTFPERYAFIVEHRYDEPPRGAARLEWMREVEQRLRMYSDGPATSERPGP